MVCKMTSEDAEQLLDEGDQFGEKAGVDLDGFGFTCSKDASNQH